MAFQLHVPDKALKFLQAQSGKKFTSREIAQELFTRYPEECSQKRDRSKAKVAPLDTDAALIQQISAELNASTLGKLTGVKMTDERPRHYYFSLLSDEDEVKDAESAKPKAHSIECFESDLYPILGAYLKRELRVNSKRIDEKRSHNTHGAGGNRWLFPDIVGFENLSSSWHDEIKKCANQMGACRAKLWSFEVKKLLNRSNVREAYFQAVSNSSWANFGYLVAAEIHNSEDELRFLSGLHGIGVIKIDPKDPDNNAIMIPAKERDTVDWNIADRLARENGDFLSYVQLVHEFHLTGKVRKDDWY